MIMDVPVMILPACTWAVKQRAEFTRWRPAAGDDVSRILFGYDVSRFSVALAK